MNHLALAIIAVVAAQRLGEMIYAMRNTRLLLVQGAVEMGSGHYPLIVLLHAAWLVAIALALPAATVIYPIPLILFFILQALRIWVIASLGRFWTTRIITLRNAKLVKRGPYRWMRHPNYVVVAGEIAMLPLAFGEIWVALIFSLLNAGILFWRIREEERALAPRRKL